MLNIGSENHAENREKEWKSSQQLGEPSSGEDICEDRFEMSDINDTRWDFWPELRAS